MKHLTEQLRKKLQLISLLILDVDGTLTDGRIIVNGDGAECKEFDVRDGHGIKLLIKAGIKVMLLTGRTSKAVDHRARELGISEVCQGVLDKGSFLDKLMNEKKIAPASIAYMGDDIVDIPAFKKVGFSVAVADACDDAKMSADYVSRNAGGRGAVREICEMILKEQDKWKAVAARYGLP
ncbi:MAG: HAD-IIIA family hydrolase [Deltaproteobacteria bacterium]|nr:HAD-IIIA family hydrolase [Deltaproteobacteria bacterium]